MVVIDFLEYKRWSARSSFFAFFLGNTIGQFNENHYICTVKELNIFNLKEYEWIPFFKRY